MFNLSPHKDCGDVVGEASSVSFIGEGYATYVDNIPSESNVVLKRRDT